jgi:hypothetical protein
MKHIKILIPLFLIILLFFNSGCIDEKDDNKGNDDDPEFVYNTTGELKINVSLEKNVFQLWGGRDSINVTVELINIGNDSLAVLDLFDGITFYGEVFNETNNRVTIFPNSVCNFDWASIKDNVHILEPGESISNQGMIIGGIIPENPNWSYNYGGLLHPGKHYVIVKYNSNYTWFNKPFWNGELISEPVYFTAVLNKNNL